MRQRSLIRKKLGGMASVQGLEFNLMQRVFSVVHDNDALAAVIVAIRELGMDAEPMQVTASATPTEQIDKPWWPLALAGVAALSAEILHWVGMPEWVAVVVSSLHEEQVPNTSTRDSTGHSPSATYCKTDRSQVSSSRRCCARASPSAAPCRRCQYAGVSRRQFADSWHLHQQTCPFSAVPAYTPIFIATSQL